MNTPFKLHDNLSHAEKMTILMYVKELPKYIKEVEDAMLSGNASLLYDRAKNLQTVAFKIYMATE